MHLSTIFVHRFLERSFQYIILNFWNLLTISSEIPPGKFSRDFYIRSLEISPQIFPSISLEICLIILLKIFKRSLRISYRSSHTKSSRMAYKYSTGVSSQIYGGFSPGNLLWVILKTSSMILYSNSSEFLPEIPLEITQNFLQYILIKFSVDWFRNYDSGSIQKPSTDSLKQFLQQILLKNLTEFF